MVVVGAYYVCSLPGLFSHLVNLITVWAFNCPGRDVGCGHALFPGCCGSGIGSIIYRYADRQMIMMGIVASSAFHFTACLVYNRFLNEDFFSFL